MQSTGCHVAAVLTPDHVYYGNGTMTATRAGLDIGAVLDGTRGRFADHSTVVLDGWSTAALDAASDAVRARGWEHTRIGPWTLYRADEDRRTVAVGVRSEMLPARHLGVVLTADMDAGAVAVVLDRYIRAVGHPWRGTPATTALAHIRSTWGNDRYQPLWKTPNKCAGSDIGPLLWTREPNEWERSWGYVHTFDANAAYLGAAINAECAWSELHHTGAMAFDPGTPGYWLVRLETRVLEMNADQRRPPLLGKVRDGCAWMTTPYARFLAELGGPFDVLDSWTARAEYREDGRRRHPAGSRVLRRWGEAMRDARIAAESLPRGTLRETVREAVKRTYKDATGGMQRETMRIYRPDWADTLIDLWRATLLRKAIHVHRTQGVWPLKVKTDSLVYADCAARPVQLAEALGADLRDDAPFRLGRYKLDATQPTAVWLAENPVKVRRSR